MDVNTRVRDRVEQELSELSARIATLERAASEGSRSRADAKMRELVGRRRALQEELNRLHQEDAAAHEDAVTGGRVDDRSIGDAVQRGLARFR
jgi:hypothetical protein